MRRQKVTVYSGGARNGLGDSPFAALDGARVARDPAPAEVPAAPAREPARAAYRVPRTRKGGWPIRVERRAGGKSATVITAIEGDTAALLRALKKHCSAGGVAKDGMVEIQGDQVARIAGWLEDNQAGNG